MTEFIANEEVDENGLLVRRKKLKKIMPRKALEILSSAFKNGDVDEFFHLVCPSAPKQ